jgi:hypothetical protein
MKTTLRLLMLWIFSIVITPVFSQTVGEFLIEDFEDTRVPIWTSDVAGTLAQVITLVLTPEIQAYNLITWLLGFQVILMMQQLIYLELKNSA